MRPGSAAHAPSTRSPGRRSPAARSGRWSVVSKDEVLFLLTTDH